MTQAERKTGTDSIFGSLKIVSVLLFALFAAPTPFCHFFTNSTDYASGSLEAHFRQF